jgi:hypothetical protein
MPIAVKSGSPVITSQRPSGDFTDFVLASHAIDDILVALVWNSRTVDASSDTIFTLTSGWSAVKATFQVENGSHDLIFRAFTKKAASASETDPLFETEGTALHTWVGIAYTLTGAADPIQIVQNEASDITANADATLPSVTVNEDGSLVILSAFLSNDRIGSGTPPTGFTLRNQSEPEAQVSVCVADDILNSFSGAEWVDAWAGGLGGTTEGGISISVEPDASGALTASGTPSIDEITASGTSTQTYKASGTVSIAEVTASGVSKIIKKATGAAVAAAVVASGVSSFSLDASGSPSIEEITASGVSKIFKKSDGTPGISEITASGQSTQTLKPSGTPSLLEVEAVGVSDIIKKASGTPSLDGITASGVATLAGGLTASGSPSIDEILAAGSAKIIKEASGALTLEEILATGVVDQIQKPSGALSIETISASGVSKIIKKSSGALTLDEITASGVSGLGGILTASGNPSIDEITAVGTVIQTQKLSGAPSIEEIVASGVATKVSAVNSASGAPSIVAITASGISTLSVPPSPPLPTPTTNYSGKVALDLARPGDIRDPATDRAILYLHDAVEQLSLSLVTKHDELPDVTPDQHHKQVHNLHGEDHEDVAPTEKLVTGSVLTYVKVTDGGDDKFVALDVFVQKGYGGIRQTGTPSLSDMGASFQIVPANAELIATPLNVTQDHANDGIKFNKAGVWSTNVIISLSHNEDNAGRTFEIQLYNATDSVEIGAISVPVARNQPGTFISTTFMSEISASAKDDLLQIRIGNGDTFTSVVLKAYQFSANHISGFVG